MKGEQGRFSCINNTSPGDVKLEQTKSVNMPGAQLLLVLLGVLDRVNGMKARKLGVE
jgi:hypothetical protein